ncbi:hypothetical protein [Anaeromicrobium sediminis]|uniref:Glutamate decarboxylase n=1 Tax=Anaeromicrobium sediminis TaxID=1478221 RepID=A0A267MFB3_9FIRM|nr:hypothetical protein [Anaeromicrobium sediminis]PAB58147.1 hypothetical protein CCE28_16875 [Anaeromicrobium sediminis]
MWMTIYMAHNKSDSDRIQKLLNNEGFLVKIRSIGKDNKVYEVMVPNAEVEEAHQVIVNLC